MNSWVLNSELRSFPRKTARIRISFFNLTLVFCLPHLTRPYRSFWWEWPKRWKRWPKCGSGFSFKNWHPNCWTYCPLEWCVCVCHKPICQDSNRFWVKIVLSYLSSVSWSFKLFSTWDDDPFFWGRFETSSQIVITMSLIAAETWWWKHIETAIVTIIIIIHHDNDENDHGHSEGHSCHDAVLQIPWW